MKSKQHSAVQIMLVVLFVCIMDRQNNQNSRYHIH